MKQERCPLCGTPLIEEESDEEDSESETRSSGSSEYRGTSIEPSSCRGTIDYFSALGTRTKKIVYRCPNPECGYLSTDC